jgi:PucR family transcriptional regulator, purine catabolism regulatory protein
VSEIVVGDVLTWDHRLEWDGSESGLLRPLTWAVTIQATVPVVPPLRGGELIVLPMRILRQLQQVEMVSWSDIARLLSGEAVAGVLVDDSFDGAPVPEVPFLRAPADFLNDAESHLNRTITEHRAELYRLGSDLSRALSAASIGGADLDALVSVASDIGGRQLLLMDTRGTIVGRSRNAPDQIPFTPRDVATAGGQFKPSALPGDDWLSQGIDLPSGDSLVLAAGLATDGTPEAARLLLSQTLAAIEAFLGPAGLRERTVALPSRETVLADLMLGRVPAAEIAGRARILSIEPDEYLSVALFVGSQPGFDGRIRTELRREIRERICMLSALELAVLLPESGWDDWWSELEAIAHSHGFVTLVRSDSKQGLAWLVHATRQARTLGRLRMTGIVDSPSAFDLLLPLWDPQSFEPGPERLTLFAERLLGPLEEHDRERNSDLVQTLEGFLTAGGSTTGAAEHLNVHRNTLGYRLRRIAQLTGDDLDDEDVRLNYGLALRIRQLQNLFS